MKQFILNRLGELSTWRGIMLIISAFGLYELTDGQEHAIEALALAIFGVSHLPADDLGSLLKKWESESK
jgi:hypothetical protein